MAAFLMEKLLATGAMLILTSVCCCAPWFLEKKWRKSNKLLSFLNCLAGGVVLGAFLLHMVPDMVHGHEKNAPSSEHKKPHTHEHGHSHTQNHNHNHDESYPIGPFCAGISFLLLFSIDRLFLSHAHCENELPASLDQKQKVTAQHQHQTHLHTHNSHCSDHNHSHCNVIGLKENENEIVGPNQELSKFDNNSSHFGDEHHEDCHEADMMGGCHMEGIISSKNHLQAYTFIFALSLHSLLEGLGIAKKDTTVALSNFLVGLFAHKWLEAFALGVTVMKAKFTLTKALGLLSFYTVLTPIGILLGIWLSNWSANEKLSLALNGLASGSFLFVSCIEMIPPEFHTKEESSALKFFALCLGFSGMAVIANFHSH